MIFAGLPAATTLSGRFLVTTEPAPMTTLFPMLIPGRMVVPPPIHTSLPIVTGFAHCIFFLLSTGSRGWHAVYMLTLGPMNALSPILTSASSRMVRLKFAKKLSPT